MAPLGPFGPLLAVGCSGGADSLALAWMARRWARGRVLALVCDHGLRPGSGAEAAGVAAQLARHGIAARVLPLAVPPGPAMQARARQARRAALLAACGEAGALHLLLAHHAQDQAETLLMRALAGSGARGLSGMAALAPAAQALVLRPLLALPKARLRATCAAAGLVPVEDPSNADGRFLRARLRGVGMRLDAAPFARRRARLEAAVARRIGLAAALREDGAAWLDMAPLGRDAVGRMALARLVQVVGGKAHPPSPVAAAALLARGHGTLGGAVLRRDGLLRPESGNAAATPHLPFDSGAGPATMCFVPPVTPCQMAADTLCSPLSGMMTGKGERAT